MKKSISKGFTLLELLLATAVVASIVLYLTVFMKNQTEERQLEKTSVEMQNILQAAASYYLYKQDQFYAAMASQPYNKNDLISRQYKTIYGNPLSISSIQSSFWPSYPHDLISPKNGRYFLSNQMQFCSSWPWQKTYSSESGACQSSGVQEYNIQSRGLDGNEQYFRVGIYMSTPNLAKKLIAKLPSGAVDVNDPQQVWGYIPRPASHYNPPVMAQTCNAAQNPNCSRSNTEIVGARGWIASAGVVAAFPGDPTNMYSLTDGSEARAIVLPNCPSGYEGHYILSYMRVQTGNCVQSADYYGSGFNLIGNLANSAMYWHTQLYPKEIQGNNVPIDSEIGGYLVYSPKLIPIVGQSVCWNFPTNLTSIFNPASGTFDPGYMVEYFMTFCVPNKHWFVHLKSDTEQLCNNNNNRNGYITQCQNNWSRYNPGTATSQCPVAESNCNT